ncbi:MAG: ATP-binding cassette domain-containing protein [Parafilimonas sp.]
MIEVIGLSKHYGTKEVLKDVSLNFNNARVYGIVGDNGAGKTTLFRCIAGLENYEGEIKSNLKPLKDYLGLLITEPFSFQRLQAENIFNCFAMQEKKRSKILMQKTYLSCR